jgi:hypothetical protein
MEVNKHDAGAFNWVDLQTSDLDGARRFYGDMFGWTIVDLPIPDGGGYSMARMRDRDLCGMGLAPQDQGIPPHWNTYVSVDDIDAVTGKVAGLGGTVLLPAMDVMDHGRMSVIQDRQGAAVSLWQPLAHIGSGIVGEPNAFCWNELYTTDLASASEFYGGLLGWDLQSHEGMGIPLMMIENGGREIGTMVQMDSSWGPVPPHWAVYFAVEDCDGFLEKAKAAGGSVFMPPRDIPGVGRFAGVADPQGAHLMVIQLISH